MVFLGDVAVPFGVRPSVSNIPWRREDNVVANLEGDIVKEGESSIEEKLVFNSRHVLDLLYRCGVTTVSIANNHILDVHNNPGRSIDRLKKSKISSVGAGDSLEEARQPIRFSRDVGPSITLLSFGWSVIDCSIATSNRRGVNPLTKSNVLKSIKKVQDTHPSDKIVTFMHWNYELELYPQPMHRQLAFRAIEAGADAVIGTHSHRVQGIEFYRGSPVVYDLGNWFFAQGEYFNGTLSFPAYSSTELAFEWIPENRRTICHWFEYDYKRQSLFFEGSEEVRTSERARELTPFRGMNHNQYINFFRDHRKKRNLLPIYLSYESEFNNWLRNTWVYVRGLIIRVLMSIGLKSANRSLQEK